MAVAAAFPASTFHGYDIAEDALRQAAWAAAALMQCKHTLDCACSDSLPAASSSCARHFPPALAS